MNSNTAVRHMLNQSPVWTQNKLATHLGLSSQAMSNRMAANDLKASFLADCSSALGYQLVLVPKGSRLPMGSIPIE